MMQTGHPAPLGATADEQGTNFAVFTAAAERVELCLFGATGRQTLSHDLPECSDNVWHGYLPECRVGQRYGYRVHGRYAPDKGERCNAAKLLIDPYTRALDGAFRWDPAVFDFDRQSEPHEQTISSLDSAAFVPKSIVSSANDAAMPSGPRVPWNETIFYETNVRGYTMRHAAVDEADRGTFCGMRNADVLAYLKALGITSLELMPVHAFIDEHHLAERGLRNFWGYNSIAFFAPQPRYARSDAVAEFRAMVQSIHDVGIEVILDVVYNHTGESGHLGPTLCFRGLDNLSYYRVEPDRPGTYVNDTGCGNTLNVDHPHVQQLIVDSLRYWRRSMGVDGFRFDLATVLGRHADGFSATHPLLRAIAADEQLSDAKLVAEPWDPGPGGYQLGQFPGRWTEWNDRYRDTVRRFWRGDADASNEFAARLRGSADLFEHSGRTPSASVNLISSHDGFTLADVVSFEHRHNEANGEENRDGHTHNYSANYGTEGDTDDATILVLRRRQRLNLLATLLFSQGTPLILAGDEFGHSQRGNNNAYAQDNETGWLDWSAAEQDPNFIECVRALIRLRRDTPLLRISEFVHGSLDTAQSRLKIEWLQPDGHPMQDHDWVDSQAFCVILIDENPNGSRSGVAILVNRLRATSQIQLPEIGEWRLSFSSATEILCTDRNVSLPELSIALLQAD